MEGHRGIDCSLSMHFNHFFPNLIANYLFTVLQVEARDHLIKTMTLTMYVVLLNFLFCGEYTAEQCSICPTTSPVRLYNMDGKLVILPCNSRWQVILTLFNATPSAGFSFKWEAAVQYDACRWYVLSSWISIWLFERSRFIV